MKITVKKGNKRLNIDSACLHAWERAGWTAADKKTQDNKKVSE